MTSTFSWQNSVSLCPASFCTPWPNLPVTPIISLLSISAFQSPMRKGHFFFFDVSSRNSCRNITLPTKVCIFKAMIFSSSHVQMDNKKG